MTAGRLLPLILSTALLSSCAADGTADPGAGDRADQLDPEGSEFRCKVVEVLDDLFEEGLGSIYDFSNDGFPEFDGDSVEVDLHESDLSAIENGMILSIGQMSFGLHDAGDSVERIDDADAQIAWRATRADDDRFFTVRIFTVTGVGWVHWQLTDAAAAQCRTDFIAECEQTCDGDFECGRCEDDASFECDRPKDMAKIDCREGVEIPDFDLL